MRAARLTSIALFVVLATLAGSRAAHAQFGGSTGITGAGGTGGTTLTAADFFIGVQHDKGVNLSDFDVSRFFNKGNCNCSEPVYIYVTLLASGFAKRDLTKTGTVEVWVGSNCDNVAVRNCKQLDSVTLASFFNVGSETIPTNARTLSTYTGDQGVIDGGISGTNFDNPTCTSSIESFDQNIYVLVNNGGTNNFAPVVTRQVHVDLTPPPAPDSSQITVEGGNQALVVRWPVVDATTVIDLAGYQLLCNRAGSLQVFNTGTFGASFTSCLANGASGIDAVDPAFLCSGLLAPSTTSYRVKILQNDIPYGVAVVAVDKSGNTSTPDVFYGTPVKTNSFYDVYRDGHQGTTGNQDIPGSATGGFCAIESPSSRRGPAFAAVAAIALLGLAFARKRRRR